MEVLTDTIGDDQMNINWRLVLAGVFLLGLRSFSTIIDIALLANVKNYHEPWLGCFVLLAVSSHYQVCGI